MPFDATQSSYPTDPIVALYRDRLISEKRALFAWDGFVGETSNRDDAMAGRKAWPKEVITSDKPVLMIPFGDGKYNGGALGTNVHRMGYKDEYNVVGVGGDVTAMDTGSLRTLKYHELRTHRRRLVMPVRNGRWNEALGGDWTRQLVAEAGPDLMDLHMRDASWNGVAHALFYGHSFHVIYGSLMGGTTTRVGMSSALGGLAVTPRLHPNICIPGHPAGTGIAASGVGYRYSTWSATHATYMASVAKDIALMTSDNKFKAGRNWLRIVQQELMKKCGYRKLVRGQPNFWLAVTDGQWLQLTEDPILKAQLIYDNPKAVDQSETYLNNESFRWGGIRVFNTGYRCASRVYSYYSFVGAGNDTLATENGLGKATDDGNAGNAADTVLFGFCDNNFNPYNMVDSSINESETEDNGDKPWLSRDVAIGGVYKPIVHGLQRYKPEFFRETKDFQNMKQLALDVDYGYSRIDYGDSPTYTSCTTMVNDRSVLFLSYSPNVISL